MFPVHVERSIRKFASGLGLTIEPVPVSGYSFAFEHSGVFTLSRGEGMATTVASLTFSLSHWRDDVPDRLFALAQSEWEAGRLLRVGLTRRNDVVLAYDLDDAVISVQALERCLRLLLEHRAAFR